jgi:hypothetical protein
VSELAQVQPIAAALNARSLAFRVPSGARASPQLWVADLGEFRSWAGERTWANCFGKGAACISDPDDEGVTSCIEVVVGRRLRAAGYEAGWLNTYGSAPPPHWIPRTDHSLARTLVEPRLPELAQSIGVRGTPDVVGVTDNDVVFVECKRHPDRLGEAQIAWFEAAFAAGLPRTRMVVAEWRSQ